MGPEDMSSSNGGEQQEHNFSQRDVEMYLEATAEMDEADEAVEQREAPPEWALLAMRLRGHAVRAVAAYYALCEGIPEGALADLHADRHVAPCLFLAILDKLEEVEPGRAARFLTPQDTGEWRNPYMQ